MGFSVFILVSSFILAFIHFTAFKPRFITFEQMCDIYTEKRNKSIEKAEAKGLEYTQSFDIAYKAFLIIVSYIVYIIYIAYYVVAGLWFVEIWFWIVVAAQIITTIITMYFVVKRHAPHIDISSWNPVFIDNNYYKFLFNFLLDAIFYGNLIFFSIYRIINY